MFDADELDPPLATGTSLLLCQVGRGFLFLCRLRPSPLAADKAALFAFSSLFRLSALLGPTYRGREREAGVPQANIR